MSNLKIPKKTKLKTKIRQLFCRHKNIEEYTEDSVMFLHLQGETVYHVCDDCKKIIKTTFRRY